MRRQLTKPDKSVKKNIINTQGREKEKITDNTLFTDFDTSIFLFDIALANIGVAADEMSQRYIVECTKAMAGMNVKPGTT